MPMMGCIDPIGPDEWGDDGDNSGKKEYSEVKTEGITLPDQDYEILSTIEGIMPAGEHSGDDSGRAKCDALRAIRKKIAEANDIPYETEECAYQGPCTGTCLKCDAEVRYLDEELRKKQERGEAIIMEGIAEKEFKHMVALATLFDDFVE